MATCDDMARCDDTSVCMNGCGLRCAQTAQFYHFLSRTRPKLNKVANLKRLKSSYSLSSCLFEALKVRHLRDQTK